jgi:hypothetical protein
VNISKISHLWGNKVEAKCATFVIRAASLFLFTLPNNDNKKPVPHHFGEPKLEAVRIPLFH